MKKTLLKKYAELIVRSGLAVKKGQSVVVSANVDQEEFIALITEACYKAGAKRIYHQWHSEKTSRIVAKKEKLSAMKEVLPMELAMQKWETDELPCLLWIDSDNPDASKGLDEKKMAAARVAHYNASAKYIEARENRYQWCIAGVPSKAWAKKMFPELSASKAMEKLWESILYTSRASDGNGIENWKKHDANLKARANALTAMRLKSLHYTSSNGTDLTVGLIPGVRFEGGGESTIGGTYFQPNIPSEEVFTSPMRGEAEGIVYAAKPLCYNGHMIRDFYVKFEKGKAVDVHAKEGEEALRSILTLDEGSAYLGECALVPFDSPINNTGLIFFNTLYDENACCHLALGLGFTELVPDFEKHTEDELHAMGINKSMSHVDFMIGSKDLNVVGTDENGKQIQIFKDGNWAF